MGLDLTCVLAFFCVPEKEAKNVGHAHSLCVIVVQHCRLHSVLLSQMLIPFGGIMLLEAQ